MTRPRGFGPSRSRLLLVLGAAVAAACEVNPATIVVPPPWRDDQTIVILLESEGGAPLSAPAVVHGGAAFHLPSSTEPVVLRARAYAAPARGGPDLRAPCVILGGRGSQLPPAEDAWVSLPFVPGAGLAPTIEREATPVPLDLRLDESCAPPGWCDRVETRAFAGPVPRSDYDAVVWASDTRAFAGGGLAYDDGHLGIPLAVFEGGTVANLDLPLPAGRIRGLARDARGLVVGVTSEGHTFEIDSDGRLVRSSTLALPRGSRLVRGPMNAVYAFTSSVAFELAGGRWVPPRWPLPPPLGVRALWVTAEGRVAALARHQLWFYDGSTWSLELDSPATTSDPMDRAPLIRGYEQSLWLVNPTTRAILRRDAVSKTWQAVDNPLGDAEPKTLEPIGGGRYAILGTTGEGGFTDGATWCTTSIATAASATDSTLSPDGRTLLAVTNAESFDGTPKILSITLPDE